MTSRILCVPFHAKYVNSQSLKKPDEREEFIEWVEARYSYLKQQLLPVPLVATDLIYQGISERSYFEMFTVQTDQDLERVALNLQDYLTPHPIHQP